MINETRTAEAVKPAMSAEDIELTFRPGDPVHAAMARQRKELKRRAPIALVRPLGASLYSTNAAPHEINGDVIR